MKIVVTGMRLASSVGCIATALEAVTKFAHNQTLLGICWSIATIGWLIATVEWWLMEEK